MKKLIFLLILQFLSNILLAQNSKFIQLNPVPTKEDLFGINFIDNDNGFAVGNSGTIIKTVNGGKSWDIVYTNTSIYYKCVLMVDANMVLVAGEGGTIIKTENGGGSWSQVNTDTRSTINKIFFYNTNLGFAIGTNGCILKTTDKGNSWQKIDLGLTDVITDIYFTDENTGYTTSNNKILKTIDGGQTWSPLNHNQSNTISFYAIDFTDSNNGYISGTNGILIKTTDAGNSWTNCTTGTSYPLTNLTFTSAQIGYAGTNYGYLYRTTNAGNSWSALTTSSSNYTYCINDTTLYLVGSSGSILKTINAGLTWTSTPNRNVSDLNSAYFIDADTAYTCGYNGLVLKTTNKGKTWVELPKYRSTAYLNDIAFINKNEGYIVGDNSIVGYTPDGGKTWESCSLPFGTDYYYDIYSYDQNTIFICGLGGKILKRTSDIRTFRSVTSGTTNTLRSICFKDAYSGFAVGANGTLLKTTNAGATWTVVNTGETETFSKIFFPTQSIGYIVAYEFILKTIDGGKTWTKYNYPTKGTYFGFDVLNENTCFVFIDNILYKTKDGCNTWEAVSDKSSSSLNCIHFVSEDLGYLFGSTIMKFDNTQDFENKGPATANEPIGSGSLKNPYLIATLEDLLWLSQTTTAWNKYFVQTQDIDASETATWNAGKGFNPIGSGDGYANFRGHYNGNGHKISNLTINRPSEYYIGLFGSFSGEVKNLGLENTSVTGYGKVGSFVGSSSGKIENCYNTGNISGTFLTGGITADNNGQILYCHNSGKVTSLSTVIDNIDEAGGICANNYGRIVNTYNVGLVTGGNANSQQNYVGGIVGINKGNICNCYNWGKILGLSYVGGLVSDNEGTICNAYNIGKVTHDVGIAESSLNVPLLSMTYWNSDSCKVGIVYKSDYSTAKTTAEMKSSDFLDLLNNNRSSISYVTSKWITSPEGYPVFEPIVIDTIHTENALTKNSLIKVYPNPTKDYITIDGSNGIVNLYNLFGQLVLSLDTQQTNEISLKTLIKGVYILRINGECHKIIKE